jgi:hypothetical protein
MGIAYNTSIVRNGLMLHLDAANLKSYPGSGTAWTDLSGNNRHGTLINGVGYSSNNNGILTFDGLNDYVTVPHDTTISQQVFGTSTNFTLSSWVNTSVFKNWATVISKTFGSSYSNTTVGIWINSTGYQVVAGSNEGGNPGGSSIILSLTATTNTWYNIVAIGNGVNLLFYSNGDLVASAAFSSITRVRSENTEPITIGKRATTVDPTHSGSISEISVYNRALTATEIRQNFEATRGRYGL